MRLAMDDIVWLNYQLVIGQREREGGGSALLPVAFTLIGGVVFWDYAVWHSMFFSYCLCINHPVGSQGRELISSLLQLIINTNWLWLCYQTEQHKRYEHCYNNRNSVHTCSYTVFLMSMCACMLTLLTRCSKLVDLVLSYYIDLDFQTPFTETLLFANGTSILMECMDFVLAAVDNTFSVPIQRNVFMATTLFQEQISTAMLGELVFIDCTGKYLT